MKAVTSPKPAAVGGGTGRAGGPVLANNSGPGSRRRMMSEKVSRALASGVGATVKDGLWYAVAAGLLWLGFYVLFRRRMARRKVVPRPAPPRQIGVEVARSLR